MEPNPPSSTPAPAPAGPARKSKFKKWLKIAGIAVVVLILFVIIFVPMIVRSVIRSQLESAVASNMNATVELGDLVWHPLLGVTIKNARILATGPDGKQIPIAEFTSLDAGLASLPFGGPINVDDFVLLNPSVDLVQQPDGTIELQPNLLKPQPATPASTAGSSKKPSELIHIRHFKISDMTVHVIDLKNPSASTTAWLHLTVEGTATGPGDYDIHVDMNEKPLTQMTLDTSINIDGNSVKFKNFAFNVTAPAEDALGQLPPQMAAFIHDRGLSGGGLTVSIANGASISCDTVKNHWSIQGLNGRIQLTSPAGKPLADGAVVFDVNGGGSMPSASTGSPLDYFASLDPDTKVSVQTPPNSEIRLTSGLPQPVTGGAFDFEYANNAVTLKSFDAKYGPQAVHMDLAAALASGKLKLNSFNLKLAGGTVVVDSAELDLAKHHYAMAANFNNIQLADLKQFTALDEPKLCGVAAGKVSVSGDLPPGVDPLTQIQGDGDAQVEQGDFWDIPFLGDVASKINPNFGSAGRVGSAAVVYTLGNSKITFSKMAVSSPIIGVQGQGDIGLTDKHLLDLTLVAAPLGDWEKTVNNTGIPGVNVFGKALGNVQGALNKVSEQALLSFHVTGPADSPSLEPVAAPALTGATKDIFNNMVKGGGNAGNDLLNLIQPKKK